MQQPGSHEHNAKRSSSHSDGLFADSVCVVVFVLRFIYIWEAEKVVHSPDASVGTAAWNPPCVCHVGDRSQVL